MKQNCYNLPYILVSEHTEMAEKISLNNMVDNDGRLCRIAFIGKIDSSTYPEKCIGFVILEYKEGEGYIRPIKEVFDILFNK